MSKGKLGVELQLRVTGGVVMMLEFATRAEGTRDCDVLRAVPGDRLTDYSRIIAAERGWPEKWLNTNAAKFDREAKAPETMKSTWSFAAPVS